MNRSKNVDSETDAKLPALCESTMSDLLPNQMFALLGRQELQLIQHQFKDVPARKFNKNKTQRILYKS